MLGLILGILLAVLFISVVVGVSMSLKTKGKTVLKLVGYPVALLLLVAFIIMFCTVRSVDTQEIAVVTEFGKVTEVKSAGFYTASPISKYHKFDTKTQEIRYDGKQNEEVSFYSKDSQPVESSLTVQYKLDISKVEDIYRTYGTLKRLDAVISSLVVERTKSALSTYSAEDLIAQREALSSVIQLSISLDVTTKNYPIVLSAVYLTNFDFSDAFEAAVEAKMIAEQEKLKAETEKQIAIIKAEQDLEISKINAEKAIAVAQGEARAVVLAATAQADALKIQTVEVARMLGFDIIETSYVDDEGNTVLVYNIDFSSKTAEDIALISKYVEYIAYLETWNGVLPQVITDGSVSIFIPIP